LLDKERRGHVNDFDFEPALGLFAGLNVLPKKSFVTAYSYRTARPQQQALLAGWVPALARLLFPEGRTFSLDFHPIPYRGDDAGPENHHIPLAGKASPSVLTFFALEQGSRVLCYANANLVRAEQPGEVLRFVESWRGLAGTPPQWLYFDPKVTTYPELSQLNQQGVWFVTIRRRGSAVVRRLRQLPASSWRGDRYAQAVPPGDPLLRRAGTVGRPRRSDPAGGGGRPRQGAADPAADERPGGDGAGPGDPLRGPQPGGGRAGQRGELLPPELPVE
jgi:hypothetical protein